MPAADADRQHAVLRHADWDQALAALGQGATLLTANARLARRVLGEDAARRRAAGESVWSRPDVLPYTAWLRRLHEDALAAGVIESDEAATLLSPMQGEALWQQVIEADLPEDSLLQSAAAAGQALEAHQLSRAWRIGDEALEQAPGNEDAEAFQRWRRSWLARLDQNRWIDPAALPERAAQWLSRTPKLRPSAIYLLGFEEYTPQQQALFDKLGELGIKVHELPFPEVENPSRVRIACTDAEGEIQAAAHWARQKLADDPAARIGIVVRDLSDRRASLARHLDAVLEPAARREPGHRRDRPWNISLGRALADEPLIHDALLVLSAAGGKLDFSDASRLLRSPFLGEAEAERDGRIRVELELRDRGEPRIDTRWLARLAREHAPRFAERLERLRETAREHGERASPGNWSEHFAAWLHIAGWPGERGLDSHEYQCVGAWQDLLRDLATLGAVTPELGREAAVGRLQRLAGEQAFQPASAPAPVQVLGLFEALGQDFDAVWIMGLHDEAWPEVPRPNPFLPLPLQRERDLPHATAARELAWAEGLTRHLTAAAPEVVVSWPQRSEDRILRPSPLIIDLPEAEAPQTRLADPWQAVLHTGALETLEDDHGPAVSDGRKVSGGTRLFQDQSACPFRAFAVHRLGADALESPSTGLDPRDRGILVHQILHRLWEELGDRKSLERLDEQARRERVLEHVNREVDRLAKKRPKIFTPRFTEVEKRRLEALLMEWLEIELARPDFRVVEQETTLNMALGFLGARGRVDRVDELADGTRILIDYKTGRSSHPGQWLGERPEDPQLPLYAIHYGKDLAGLVIGQVYSHQCRWKGVARDQEQVPGSYAADNWKAAGDSDWDSLTRDWREMADRLAEGIMAGEAAVDPLPNACDYCHLAALCRINDA